MLADWPAANNTWRSRSAGRRYDIGVRYGLLTAQLALALSGRDRDDVLSQLVELLATRETRAAGSAAA